MRISIQRTTLGVLFVALIGFGSRHAFMQASAGTDTASDELETRFTTKVRPLLERYCFGCHGPTKQRGSLDLSRDANVAAVASHFRHWEAALEKLQSMEMPPEDAPRQPEATERATVVA